MHRLSLLTNPPKSADFLTSLHHASHTLFTPRYIGFVGGVILLILFVAVTMVENATQPAPLLQHTAPSNHASSLTPTTPATDDNSLPNSATSSETNTKLEVNGQNIPVPHNSDTTQTVTSGNTQTTIHTSETSTQGSNSNSSNVTIHVDSVTSGGT